MADRDLRLRMIFSSTDKASGAMRAVASGSKVMAKELKATSGELDKLNNAQNRITGFRKLKGELGETSKQLDAAEKKVSSLARSIGQTESPTRKMVAEFNRAKREAGSLKDKHAEQQRSLQSLRDELAKTGISTKSLADHERKLRTEISETNDKLNSQKAKIAAVGEQRERSARIKEKMGERADKAQNIGLASSAASLPLGLLLKSSADKAIAAGEQVSALNITFKQSGENIEAWSTKTGLAMGRSITSIRNGAQMFGIYFNEATNPKRASALAKQFTILAQDMGSFYNVSGGVMQDAISAGLRGESEPLRRYGVFLSDNAVKAKALAIGLKPVGKEFTDQQKVMARAALIMEKTKNAQGDVARTSDSTANRIRAASEGWENLQLTIGEKLIPTLPLLITALTSVIEAFAGLSPETQKFIVMAALAGVAFGPLMIGLSGVFRGIGAMSGGISRTIGIFKKAENGISPFSNALKKVKDGASAIGPKVASGASSLKKVGSAALTMGRSAVVGLAGYAKLAAGMAVGGLRAVAGALLSVGRAALVMGRAFLLNPVVLIITGIAVAAYLIYQYWTPVSAFFSNLWGGVTKFFANAWTNIKAGVQLGWLAIRALFFNYHPIGLIYTHWSGITAWFGALWVRVRGVFSGAWAGIKGMMSGWGASMWNVGSQIMNGIVNGIKAAPGAVWEALKGVVFGGIDRIRAFIGLGPSGAAGTAAKGIPKIAGARALGGPVSAGRTYLVGERGPELFTAPFSGLVTANDKLRQMAKLATIGGGAAILSSGPALAAPRSSFDAGGGGNQYSITLKFEGSAAGIDERRIADAVQRAIAEIERESGAKTRAEFRDDA